MQGRTTYGGLSAALCIASCDHLLPEQIPLRSAQFCFVGPTSGVVRVTPTILRRGKSTTLVAVDLYGEDGLSVRGTLVFGHGRTSAYSYPYEAMPSLPGPDGCPPFFGGAGTAKFTDHFEARRAAGAEMVSAASVPEFAAWVRHRDQKMEMGMGSSLAWLMTLGDALPPPAMALFDKAAPISTMTWSMDFPSPSRLTNSAWYLVTSRAELVSSGYSTQAMCVWSTEGEALMIGRQNVAIFV